MFSVGFNSFTDSVLAAYRLDKIPHKDRDEVAHLCVSADAVLERYPDAGPFRDSLLLCKIVAPPGMTFAGRDVAALPPNKSTLLHLPIDIFKQSEAVEDQKVLVFKEVEFKRGRTGQKGRGVYPAYSRFRLRDKESNGTWSASPVGTAAGSNDHKKRTPLTTDEFMPTLI